MASDTAALGDPWSVCEKCGVRWRIDHKCMTPATAATETRPCRNTEPHGPHDRVVGEYLPVGDLGHLAHCPGVPATAAACEHDEIGWAYGVLADDVGDCGCGYTEERLELLRQVLRDCPLYEDERWRKYDSALAQWLLVILTNADLIEHGGSVGGSWITDKGKRLLAVLDSDDGWSSLALDQGPSYGYCQHCLEAANV